MNAFQRLKSSGGKLLVLISFVLAFQGIIGASNANAACLSREEMALLSPGDGTYRTCGGDDRAYRIPISGTVVFGGVTYSSIFATTNSVISFGEGDTRFGGFPFTPSIVLDQQDWYVSPIGSGQRRSDVDITREDEYLNITVSGETFIVDLSTRPYRVNRETVSRSIHYTLNSDGSYSYTPQVDPTRMRFVLVRNSDGTLRVSTYTSDSTNTALRNGCVLTSRGTPISLAECGVYEGVIEELSNVEKINYLVVTTPLVVSQSKDAVMCTGAKLNYMIQGVQAVTPQLDTQSYFLKVDGVVVAHKATLDTSASFDKRLLPTTGTATCSQVATQDGSQLTIESGTSSAPVDAAKIRKAEVEKINATFNARAKKLLEEKLSHLLPGNMKKYTEASQQWQVAHQKAKDERDAAIRAANAKELNTPYALGMKVDLKG